ncbi:hypothetical protein BDW59DRAFT_166716 [Aspergillus cavernicola]|uniref:Uncharacterized protein n=1 Tax=Aspergillus cavernicola TaxID=176166 RepID=A0ABR4HJI5_9EURO
MATSTCYWPNDGEACLSNNLCYGSKLNIAYRGACTDNSWPIAECPRICYEEVSNQWANLYACPNSSNQVFTCGTGGWADSVCSRNLGMYTWTSGHVALARNGMPTTTSSSSSASTAITTSVSSTSTSTSESSETTATTSAPFIAFYPLHLWTNSYRDGGLTGTAVFRLAGLGVRSWAWASAVSYIGGVYLVVVVGSCSAGDGTEGSGSEADGFFSAS